MKKINKNNINLARSIFHAIHQSNEINGNNMEPNVKRIAHEPPPPLQGPRIPATRYKLGRPEDNRKENKSAQQQYQLPRSRLGSLIQFTGGKHPRGPRVSERRRSKGERGATLFSPRLGFN